MEQMDLCGTGVALVTPFNDDETVDYASLEKIVNHVIHGGVNYLVVMGTTGESVTIDQKDKKKILEFIIEKNNGRLPIVLGIGGYNTREVVSTIKETDLSAVSAILSVSPYYNKPTQQGIYEHYKYIAQNTDKPVVLYNVPGRTGKNIEADTALRLATNFSNIKALKEASGDMAQIMELLKNKPDSFSIISGDDALTFPMMALGACGVISVIANAYPQLYSKMVNLADMGDYAEARKLHYKLLKMIELLFKEGSPAGVKVALNQLGLCSTNVRLPLVKASDALMETIKHEMGKIG